MKVEIELPELPDGWEYTGEYRVPKTGENVLNADGEASIMEARLLLCGGKAYPILKRKRWRAERGGTYCRISNTLRVEMLADLRSGYDDVRWSAGNYFKTEAEAMDAAEKVKALLLSLHD